MGFVSEGLALFNPLPTLVVGAAAVAALYLARSIREVPLFPSGTGIASGHCGVRNRA